MENLLKKFHFLFKRITKRAFIRTTDMKEFFIKLFVFRFLSWIELFPTNFPLYQKSPCFLNFHKNLTIKIQQTRIPFTSIHTYVFKIIWIMYFCIILILLAAKHRALAKVFHFSSSSQSLNHPPPPSFLFLVNGKKRKLFKNIYKNKHRLENLNVFHIKMLISCFYMFECEFVSLVTKWI